MKAISSIHSIHMATRKIVTTFSTERFKASPIALPLCGSAFSMTPTIRASFGFLSLSMFYLTPFVTNNNLSTLFHNYPDMHGIRHNSIFFALYITCIDLMFTKYISVTLFPNLCLRFQINSYTKQTMESLLFPTQY